MYHRGLITKILFIFIFSLSVSFGSINPVSFLPDSVKAINNVNDLQPFFESDKFADKKNGIKRLGQIGTSADIPFLLELFNNTPYETENAIDRSRDIKDYTILAIGTIGGHEAESALLGIIDELDTGKISLKDSLDIIRYSCYAFADMSSSNALYWLNSIYTDTLLTYGYRVDALEAIYLINLSRPEYSSAKDTVEYLLNELSSNFSSKIQQIDDFIITKAIRFTLRDISSQDIFDELSSQSTKFVEEIELKKYIDSIKSDVRAKNNSPVNQKRRWLY